MNKRIDTEFLEALKYRPDLTARKEFKEELAQKLEIVPRRTKRRESIKISGLIVVAAILLLLTMPNDWRTIINDGLSGGTEQKNTTISFLTDKQAIEISEKMAQSDQVTWKTYFREEYTIEIDYKDTKVGPIWIVEGEYPQGNKDLFYIDAISGELILLSEEEASDKIN